MLFLSSILLLVFSSLSSLVGLLVRACVCVILLLFKDQQKLCNRYVFSRAFSMATAVLRNRKFSRHGK